MDLISRNICVGCLRQSIGGNDLYCTPMRAALRNTAANLAAGFRRYDGTGPKSLAGEDYTTPSTL
jgi:hypothetical protein